MRTILAAVDLSNHAHRVMSRAAELACLLRSDLTVLTVLDPDPMKGITTSEEMDRIAKYQRELVFKHFPQKGLTIESNNPTAVVYRYTPAGIRVELKISKGNPVERICAFAEESKVDLVIVGNRGLGGVGGLVLGSISERVVHKCSRSVLVVKGDVAMKSELGRLLDSQESRLGISS